MTAVNVEQVTDPLGIVLVLIAAVLLTAVDLTATAAPSRRVLVIGGASAFCALVIVVVVRFAVMAAT